jgi:WD40 repeat protein
MLLTAALPSLPAQEQKTPYPRPAAEAGAVWHFVLDRTLNTPSQPIAGLAFSGGSPLLAAVSGDNRVRLWRASTGELVKTISLAENPQTVFGLAFTRDGRWIAVGEGFTKSLVYAGKVELLDVEAGQDVRALTVHHWGVDGMAFSRDGQWLVTTNWDKKIRVLEFPAGTEVRALESPSKPLGVAISPDASLIASGNTDSTLTLWERASGKELQRLAGHTGRIGIVDFSPDGKLLASASSDGSARIWDVASGQSLRTLSGHEGAVTSVAFSPEGKVVASGGADGTVRLWDAATGRSLETLGAHAAVWQVSFSADGRYLAAGYANGTINIWKKQL